MQPAQYSSAFNSQFRSSLMEDPCPPVPTEDHLRSNFLMAASNHHLAQIPTTIEEQNSEHTRSQISVAPTQQGENLISAWNVQTPMDRTPPSQPQGDLAS